MPRISCTCDCSFSSFRHLNFHSGFEPICSYSSVQKSSKVPCFFSFFLFYLALLLLYLFPVSLPPLFLFPVTVTGCKTGVRLPENAEISTFFYSALANDRNRPVHPFSTWETLKAVKGPGFEPDPSSSDKGYKCVELYLHSRD